MNQFFRGVGWGVSRDFLVLAGFGSLNLGHRVCCHHVDERRILEDATQDGIDLYCGSTGQTIVAQVVQQTGKLCGSDVRHLQVTDSREDVAL